jgi:hypothetical protein
MSLRKGERVTIQHIGRPVEGVIYRVVLDSRDRIIGVQVELPGKIVVYRKVTNGRIQ